MVSRGNCRPESGKAISRLQPLYLRALGETGARDELLLDFTANAKQMSAAVQHAWLYDISLLPVLAFGGRLEALAHLLETKLGKLSRETKEFWLGIGELSAGETMAGRARLENLRATTADALVRAEAAQRLERANEIARAPFSPAAEALAAAHRAEANGRTDASRATRARGRPPSS